MIPLDRIQDTETCYLQLWLLLEDTRQEFRAAYRRYCIRNILKSWFGPAATDDFVWEVCFRCQVPGLSELPAPTLEPRQHRELLRAVVATVLGKGVRHVDLGALDRTYHIAFPAHLMLNISKKRRPP